MARWTAEITTIRDAEMSRSLYQVGRQFQAQSPNKLWVSDFTEVSTWQGWLCVAQVVDEPLKAKLIHHRAP